MTPEVAAQPLTLAAIAGLLKAGTGPVKTTIDSLERQMHDQNTSVEDRLKNVQSRNEEGERRIERLEVQNQVGCRSCQPWRRKSLS